MIYFLRTLKKTSVVDNYVLYYLPDESEHTVAVLRFVYAKRNLEDVYRELLAWRGISFNAGQTFFSILNVLLRITKTNPVAKTESVFSFSAVGFVRLFQRI